MKSRIATHLAFTFPERLIKCSTFKNVICREKFQKTFANSCASFPEKRNTIISTSEFKQVFCADSLFAPLPQEKSWSSFLFSKTILKIAKNYCLLSQKNFRRSHRSY